ncbi:hypothetical protein KEM54_001995, partial [Ascosphaera aggregata]
EHQQQEQPRYFDSHAFQGIAAARGSCTGNYEPTKQTMLPPVTTPAYGIPHVHDESLLGTIYSDPESAKLNAHTQSNVRGQPVPVLPITVTGSAPEVLITIQLLKSGKDVAKEGVRE